MKNICNPSLPPSRIALPLDEGPIPTLNNSNGAFLNNPHSRGSRLQEAKKMLAGQSWLWKLSVSRRTLTS